MSLNSFFAGVLIISITLNTSKAFHPFKQTSDSFSIHLKQHDVKEKEKRNVFLLSQRKPLYGSNIISNDSNLDKDENFIRDCASTSLMNVFYRIDENGKCNNESKIMDTEKSLKKSLRHMQIQLESNSLAHPVNNTATERSRLRKRLSELVLGTSVMRLKYWFYAIRKKREEELLFLKNEPIHGAEDFVAIFHPDHNDSCNETLENPANERPNHEPKIMSKESMLKQLIREMVDCHAEELQKSKPPLQYSCEDNGVRDYLLSMERKPPEHLEAIELSIQHSLPLFLSKLLIDQYGFNVSTELAKVSNRPGPITLRRNSIQCLNNEELASRLIQQENIHVMPIHWNRSLNKTKQEPCRSPSSKTEYALRIHSSKPKSIWNIDAWKDGQFEVQDLGSQLVVQAMGLESLILNSREMEDLVVVDFCAGNGGKTFAIASAIVGAFDDKFGNTKISESMDQKKGDSKMKIIAHDVNTERLKQILGSSTRVGFHDGVYVHTNVKNLGGKKLTLAIKTTDNFDSIPSHSADMVLVDAPCSSLGVLRRRPSQRWILSEKEVTVDFPKLQLEILQQASRIVKPGGRLIYATCSISQFENENVAGTFESFPKFKRDWEVWDFEEVELRHEANPNWRQLLPHVDDSDGFFIARWKRLG